MKPKEIILTSVYVNPVMEAHIQKRDMEIKELAINNAKHFAGRNQPAAVGDTLAHYVGEITAGYEKLVAALHVHLQPNSNVPEAKIDADYYKDRDSILDASIKDLKHKNKTELYELGNFDPHVIKNRILLGFGLSSSITIGEIIYNTKSFQITGENLLFAFFLSLAITIAIFIFSHLIPNLYKAAKNKPQRILAVAVPTIIATAVFITLAVFRSKYLAAHNIHINPAYFVIINLFFFIVSSLLSFYIVPSWKDIRQNAHGLIALRRIEKAKKEIAQMQLERDEIKKKITERTKERVRIMQCAKDYKEQIRKMSKESVEAFKRTNLAYRTDCLTPDCFNDAIELDIEDISFNYFPNRRQS